MSQCYPSRVELISGDLVLAAQRLSGYPWPRKIRLQHGSLSLFCFVSSWQCVLRMLTLLSTL